MRTNIEIDDELMQQAIAATGATSKKAAVEASLRKLIDVKAREQARAVARRLQEESRQAAIREGRLDEWYEELKRSGTRVEEPAYADQH
jgi:Arc/MetJ family transcription regulator